MSSPCILVVEDNDKNMKLLCDVLELNGYLIVRAHSGEEALDLVDSHEPDAVLLDLRLPGIDGVETLARLRVDGRLAETPALALTAQAMEGDRERCLAAGFDGYLSKPVDVLELLETVAALTGGSARPPDRHGPEPAGG